MENSVEESHGAEIPKKSRSLDLKSLYKSRLSEEDQSKKSKRKSSLENGNDEKRDKRKKSRKAVSLSSLKNVNTNSRKSLDEVYNGGLGLGLHDSKVSKLGSSEKVNQSNGVKTISLSLNDSVIQIPKRKRDFVGRKKVESSQVSKPSEQCSNRVALVDQIAKLNGDDPGAWVESLKVNQKKSFDEFKENRNGEPNSALHVKEGDGNSDCLVVKKSDSSLKKSRRNHRNRKNLGKNVAEEVEPLIDNTIKVCNDTQEEDEENLEENAARMLSSRFDPSCTGISSNNKASSTPVNGLSFLLSSGQDIARHSSKSLSESESASHDTASRILRPRSHRKEKGHSRRRRHFYEFVYRDLDADWVLNRRIKVFWPLDQSWYYGVVNDYDSERKLHHVKYDDRDEEWIDLQSERFKLLLLPSEVRGKVGQKRFRSRDKHSEEGKAVLKPRKEKEKRNLTIEDDGFLGSCMDSEPIISWLALSTRRVKSSPLRAIKKQKTSDLRLTCAPSLMSTEVVNAHGSVDRCSLEGNGKKFSGNSVLSDRLSDDGKGQASASEGPPFLKNSKLPIVYFRRRFHKSGKALSQTSERNDVSGSAPESVTSSAPVFDGLEHSIQLGRLDPDEGSEPIVNSGLLKLNISLEKSRQLVFDLSFPVLSTLKCAFEVENLWLFRSLLLQQHGTVMTMWPTVYLEMLFVDNTIGLRFLLFEGCLKQAVSFVLVVLSIFHQPSGQQNYANLQLPSTSIRFRISCGQDFKRQLVFVFFCFSEVKELKWRCLDNKLKKHCLVSKQLPVSECTYDNIKALHNGSNPLLSSSVSGSSASIEGMLRRSMRGINVMAVSRESTYLNVSPSCSKSSKRERKLPSFALSFTAAPTFFLSLHVKLLVEHSVAHIRFQDPGSTERSEDSTSPMADDDSKVEDCVRKGLDGRLKRDMQASKKHGDCVECLSFAKSELGTLNCLISSDVLWMESSQEHRDGHHNLTRTSSSFQNAKKIGTNAIEPLQKWPCPQSEIEQCLLPSELSGDRDKCVVGPLPNGIRVEIPPFNHFERHADRDLLAGQQSTDLSWNMNGRIIPSPNPTAPRSTSHRNRSSTSFGSFMHGWSDGKADIFQNNFGNGPKKPRTQVSYSVPFGGFVYSPKTKTHHEKGLPHKRIRRASEKRLSDVSKNLERNLELLSCVANVLITTVDRGWRESGAQVVLELFDRNEWKLAVKLSGATKYSYKAHQFLQPGSTNRYTHAMMWKGGKDWTLEFPDKSQWTLFKEMHEECYNRNIRAALVKNIPIPGVCLIEENDDNGLEGAFVRNASKYFRQVATDVEMALDPSRVMYDMDSDDEQWILKNRRSSEVDSSSGDIFEELFEKTMDMFEKAAYAQQHDQFTSDEIEELMVGVGSMEVIKAIHEHWWQKRQRKGMPLIRHLQPPLWERYQQEVREWELSMTKVNASVPNEVQERVAPNERPPMFAFCLKPRGLEVPNKGSKHRSQKKFSIAGKSSATSGDHDGFHSFGRRLNGFAFVGEKAVYPGYNYESLDDSPLHETSPMVFFPRDGGSMGFVSTRGEGFDRNHHQKLHRSKSKKSGMFASPSDMHMLGSSNQRMMSKRNGVYRWNMGYSDWSSPRHYNSDWSHQRFGPDQLDDSDLDEFRLRDASGAAQHARNMAKLKREKAQRLLYRADLAIHKAVVALMTAEAMKASSQDVSGDG